MQSTRLRILNVSSAPKYRGRLPHTTSRFNSIFKANSKDSSLASNQRLSSQSQSARAGLDKNKSRGGKSSSQLDAASLNSVPKALERATQSKSGSLIRWEVLVAVKTQN